jgi:hypothetical protein
VGDLLHVTEHGVHAGVHFLADDQLADGPFAAFHDGHDLVQPVQDRLHRFQQRHGALDNLEKIAVVPGLDLAAVLERFLRFAAPDIEELRAEHALRAETQFGIRRDAGQVFAIHLEGHADAAVEIRIVGQHNGSHLADHDAVQADAGTLGHGGGIAHVGVERGLVRERIIRARQQKHQHEENRQRKQSHHADFQLRPGNFGGSGHSGSF